MDRARTGAVCGPSQPTKQRVMTNNDADQQAVSPLVSIAITACTSALLGLPEDLVNLQDCALAGQAGLRDSQPPELLRLGSDRLSSLVSSVYVHRRSSVFGLMRQCGHGREWYSMNYYPEP